MKLYRIPNQFGNQITLQTQREHWTTIIAIFARGSMRERMVARELQAQLTSHQHHTELVPVTLTIEDATKIMQMTGSSG